MKRAWQVWTVFAACLLVAVAAVGWLSYRALQSERAELAAQSRAVLEEDTRLALWRIDSAVAALVAEENANPYLSYRSFRHTGVPTKTAKVFRDASVPSPLLTAINPLVKLHFEIDAAGQLVSPVVPPDDEVGLAVPRFLSNAQLEQNRQLLNELQPLVDGGALLALLPEIAPAQVAAAPDSPAEAVDLEPQVDSSPAPSQAADDSLPQQVAAANQSQRELAGQQARNSQEFRARQQVFSNNSSRPTQSAANQMAVRQGSAFAEARPGVMTPLWLGGDLLLVRRVVVDRQAILQGAWLDWPRMRDLLLASVRDLLPDAELLPVDPAAPDEPAHRMAALPVTLIAGSLPAAAVEGLSPVRLSLLVTWCSLVLAALAVGLLLAGVLALSERRAAFVSAVTHELRTPLTTFRMYSEMLAEGMVPDEADRRRYLETLHIEANRLTHLVENVLAYARLERGRQPTRVIPVPVGELLERGSERAATRAEGAGFCLERSVPAEIASVAALADPAAVEQIVFNLVDNACKYAASAKDRTLRLAAVKVDSRVLIRVSDHGPGVSPRQRGQLFQAFRKSASEAAHSAPGVGLGLALCRRLARDMGGDLTLDDHATPGATFVLTLKAVSS